jgi:hypothetical protein
MMDKISRSLIRGLKRHVPRVPASVIALAVIGSSVS